LIIALVRGARANSNPWGSRSYEWEAASPPIKHNFETTPAFTRGPYEYDS
jgi:cytochrome c oxidase subunit 1